GMTSGLFQFDLAIILTFFASMVFYILYKFEYGKGKDTQILKVTVPENLNHENLLADILKQYTIQSKLRQVETTNLGTMILYTYAIRSKNNTDDKELLDRIREKNANLKVSITYMEGTECYMAFTPKANMNCLLGYFIRFGQLRWTVFFH